MGNRFQGLILATLISIFFLTGCTTTRPSREPVREVEREPSAVTTSPKSTSLHLSWPLIHHRLSRGFDPDEPHEGLDLRATKGTPILAADDGRVVYSGHAFHGYGKMVLIEHESKVATLYGHCSKIFVRTGDRVIRGHKIALVGKTGRATAPHLHFEVRQNKHPVDPLSYLP